MKKLLALIVLLLSTTLAFASADSKYDFKGLQKNMETEGFVLDYVKKDVGFNFKKGISNVELLGFKDYRTTTEALAVVLNVFYKNGLELIPTETDIGNGVYTFSYAAKPEYFGVVAVDFEHNVIVQSFATAKELEKVLTHLKNTSKK